MNKRRNKAAAGFTLVEIMVVLVILGLLAAVVAQRFAGRVDRAKQLTATTQIKILDDAIEMFYTDNGVYPTADQGLTALVKKPAKVKFWPDGGYLKDGILPKDPWGNDYVYVVPGSSGPYEIICYGRDGRQGGDGTDGDITNVTIKKQSQ